MHKNSKNCISYFLFEKDFKCCFIIVLLIFLSIPLIFLINRARLYRRVEGHAADMNIIQNDTNLSSLSRNLLSQHLPAEAEDIFYEITPSRRHINATFIIDQGDFKQWAEKNDWNINEITARTRIPMIFRNTCNSNYLVKNGFKYNKRETRDTGMIEITEVLYDSNKQRCYYRYYDMQSP